MYKGLDIFLTLRVTRQIISSGSSGSYEWTGVVVRWPRRSLRFMVRVTGTGQSRLELLIILVEIGCPFLCFSSSGSVSHDSAQVSIDVLTESLGVRLLFVFCRFAFAFLLPSQMLSMAVGLVRVIRGLVGLAQRVVDVQAVKVILKSICSRDSEIPATIQRPGFRVSVSWGKVSIAHERQCTTIPFASFPVLYSSL